MEMAVVFREGHCSLHGKIMRTIFHSIKLLHLAQLATHTKVKERDLFIAARSGTCAWERRQIDRRAPIIYHGLNLNIRLLRLECFRGVQHRDLVRMRVKNRQRGNLNKTFLHHLSTKWEKNHSQTGERGTAEQIRNPFYKPTKNSQLTKHPVWLKPPTFKGNDCDSGWVKPWRECVRLFNGCLMSCRNTS